MVTRSLGKLFRMFPAKESPLNSYNFRVKWARLARYSLRPVKPNEHPKIWDT